MPTKKISYSFAIGLVKSLKNTAAVLVLPAIAFLIDHYVEWIPAEYNTAALPIFGFLSYLIKNYLENK